MTTQTSNSDLLRAIRDLSMGMESINRRLGHLEADVALIRAAFVQHGKQIGNLVRATPIPMGDDL